MTAAILALVLSAAMAHGVEGNSAVSWVNCESMGSPAAVNGPYVGLTQLDLGKRTDLVERWAPQQGLVGDPSDASQQINYSLDIVVTQGWHSWPQCGVWLKWTDGARIPERLPLGGYK